MPTLREGGHSTRGVRCSLDGCRVAGKHEYMASATGTWSQIDLAGHLCRLYEPPSPSLHNYTVIYLHCSEAASLRGHPAFVQEFDRHGLRVIEPVTGRSWWTDRIWP